MSDILRTEFKNAAEEIANSITHGIGVLLSIAALVILIVVAQRYGHTPWHVVGFAIFGSMLILLYLASTLYHAIQHPGAKKVFKRIDHAAIYLLIAGTYTPFLFTNLKGPWGWTLFGIIWGLAVIGVVFKAISAGKYDRISLLVYILMGWLVIVAIKPMLQSVPVISLIWLVIGGVAYTAGTIFYAWERLPFNHAIWHMFVLAGSTAHFFSVLYSI